MARILLNSPAAGNARVDTAQQVRLGTAKAAAFAHLSPAAIEARLREKRSPSYVEAMKRLDAGAHAHDAEAAESFINAIRQELPELSIDQLPIGIVSRCYLGDPYEVHTLGRDGMIIQHYKRWEPLPGPLEGARGLSLHPGYAFVEVYPDKLIAVSENGSTSLVNK
jgi:hypothetical protein